MTSISWRARSLKVALRAALTRSGISAREVANQLGVSHTKVNRWLRDDAPPPSEADTASLLAVASVTGDERERVLAIARTQDVDWLVSGPPGINPQLASVLELERYATRITEWAPLGFPGLLQSAVYARDVFARSGLAPAEVEASVMMRIARRDALTRPNPVQFSAFVGLPAVHGWRDEPAVMADQLSHVRGVTALENVTMQVVDLNRVWTPGHAGAFILYEFDNDMPSAVYLEHYRSGAVIGDEADVAAYKDAAEAIRRAAMSPEATAELIAGIIPSTGMETTH